MMGSLPSHARRPVSKKVRRRAIAPRMGRSRIPPMSKPLPPLSATELKTQIDAGDPPRLVDVREPHEFVSELGHIAGSELIPLGSLPAAAATLEGETREIAIICRSGMRAGQAADFLAKRGLKVRVLTGGMIAWNEAQLPISRDPA